MGRRSTTRALALPALLAWLCACGGPSGPAETPRAPQLVSTSFVGATRDDAVLQARIIPGSAPATYHCEFGLSDPPGMATADSTLAAGQDTVDVVVVLEPLLPDTLYVYRWVVTSAAGVVEGELDSLVTRPPNRLPETYLVQAPVDTVEGEVRLHAYWFGTDADGMVQYFDWRRSDGGVLSAWRKTAVTDSVFVLVAGTSFGLELRAVDDEGAIDPTPASLSFP